MCVCLRISWTWNADRSRCPEGVMTWWLHPCIQHEAAAKQHLAGVRSWSFSRDVLKYHHLSQQITSEASLVERIDAFHMVCGCLVTCEIRPHSRKCQRIQRWGWWGVMFQNCWHGLGEISPWELKGFKLYVFPNAFLPLLGCEKGSFSSRGSGFGFAWKVGGLVVFVVDPWC